MNFNIGEYHIFPKSLLRAYGMLDKADLLPNIAFINPGTNKLRDQPLTYIQKYNISESELEKQLIPTGKELLKIENYDRFLDEIAKLISYEINKYLFDLYPKHLR